MSRISAAIASITSGRSMPTPSQCQRSSISERPTARHTFAARASPRSRNHRIHSMHGWTSMSARLLGAAKVVVVAASARRRQFSCKRASSRGSLSPTSTHHDVSRSRSWPSSSQIPLQCAWPMYARTMVCSTQVSTWAASTVVGGAAAAGSAGAVVDGAVGGADGAGEVAAGRPSEFEDSLGAHPSSAMSETDASILPTRERASIGRSVRRRPMNARSAISELT